MPKALSENTITEIRRLASAGSSLSSIARELGVSLASVHKYAPKGSFDRSATAAAVKAHQLDAAARRAEISQRLLGIIEQLAQRMGAEHTSFGWFGKDGTYRQKTHPLPPAAEMRQFAGALASLAATHVRLEQFQAGDEHQDARDAIIAFGNAVREITSVEQAEPE